MAHLFIINPLHGERMDSLFSTHPSTDNRIAALQAMAPRWKAATRGPHRARRRRRSSRTNGSHQARGARPAQPEQPAEPAEPKPNPWGRNPTGPKGPWS